MSLVLHIDGPFPSKERFLDWARSCLPLEDLGLEMGDSWDAFIEVLSCCASEVDGGVHIMHSTTTLFDNDADNRVYWDIVKHDVPQEVARIGGRFKWSMTSTPAGEGAAADS